MANMHAPALGYTYIYIDPGTYTSKARSNRSAKECGPQNSRGDFENESKGLKKLNKVSTIWVSLDKHFNLTPMEYKLCGSFLKGKSCPIIILFAVYLSKKLMGFL